MTYQRLEDLPAEVTEQLPQHGQQLYMAAYNASLRDTKNEESATKIAWNSVKSRYQQQEDGSWVLTENTAQERPNIVGTKADTTDPIGNRENNTGVMRGG